MKTMYSLLLAFVMFSSCGGNKSVDFIGMSPSASESVNSDLSPAPPENMIPH